MAKSRDFRGISTQYEASVVLLKKWVDFHWEIDGQSFEFSLPGGGFISLKQLVGALGIAVDDPETEEDEVQTFIEGVSNAEFSDPELISVSKVDEDTTVGAIKEALGLVCEYSADLTEEDIAQIDAQPVEAGDWALISLKPFDTEEALTVTMRNGEWFTIRVTDAQISKTIISASGEAYEITVTYTSLAQIPDGAELKVREILKGDADYDEYYQKAVAKAAEGAILTGEIAASEAEDEADVASDGQVPAKATSYARFFDIQIWANDQKVEPQSDVFVTVSLADMPENRSADPQIVHFGDEGAELMAIAEDRADDAAPAELSFTTSGFSVYAVVVIEDYNGEFTFIGDDFTVKISYTEEAELPLGTLMTVRELEQDSEEFLRRLGETWTELNREYLEVEELRANYNEGMGYLPVINPINVDAVRFFDISFAYEGEPIEPKVPVQVEITYDQGLTAPDAEVPVAGVAHFAEEGLEMIDDVETTLDGEGGVKSFRYEQASFSDTGTFVGQETHDVVREQDVEMSPVVKKLISDLQRAASESENGIPGVNTRDGETDPEPHIPDRPQADKTLTPNDDGTYKLELSVTGAQDTTTLESVTKSNVLIVMDRSSSMVNNNTYVKYDGEHVNGTTYYGYNNNQYITLYYYDGRYYRDNNHRNPYDGDIYTRETRLVAEQQALDSLIGQLMAINRPGEYINNGTVSLADIIEAKVISFASYRSDSTDPYYSNTSNQQHGGYSSIQHNGDFAHTESGWSTNATTLLNAVNDSSTAKGTNWQEAMQYAKEMADAKKAAQPDEKVYVIFLTDGEPTDVYHGQGNAQYSGNWNERETALVAAQPDAYSIVNPHTVTTQDNQTVTTDHALYGIFTYGDTDQMKSFLRRLVNYAYLSGGNTSYNNSNEGVAGGTASYYYDASDTSQLLNAFQNILSQISNSVAYGRVSIVDGITTDAATTAVVNGSAQGFHYKVEGSVGELYSVTTSGSADGPTVTFKIGGTTYSGGDVQKKTGVDGKEYYSVTIGDTEYKMALATIDANQKVTWDLSAIGTLMGGYTYSVEFDVWPNQEAYDYVADLNNGMRTWDKTLDTYKDLTATKGYEIGGVAEFPSIVRYPNGTFSVLTNTEQEVNYSIVKTETVDGVPTTTYDGPYTIPLTPPEPMDLEDTRMSVEKVWNDKLDPAQLEEILYENGISSEYKINLLIWKAETRAELQSAIEDGQTAIDGYIAQHTGSTITDALNALHGAGCYKDIVVGWDDTTSVYDWDKDFTVAPGLIVSLSHAEEMGVTIEDANKVTYKGQPYYILDQGHYYTITEPGIDRHYELNMLIYHPMIIDGTLEQVTIEDKVVVPASEPLSQLKADNTLKGGINVEKKVLDNDGQTITHTDDTFSVTLTMKNADGTPYTDFDYRIYYGENNPNYGNTEDYPGNRTGHVFGTAAAKPGDNTNEEVDSMEPPVGKCHIVGNTDGKVKINLYVGDTLRVINVPAGVTYSVVENVDELPDAPNSLYVLDGYEYKIKTGNAVDYVDDTPNSSGTYTVKGNSASLATVVNKIPSVPMKIIKIGQGDRDKPLSGVQFKLYYDEDAQHQVLKDAIGRDIGKTITHDDGTVDYGVLETDQNGNVNLGRLIAGDYYLQEIKTNDGYVLPAELIPITITKLGNNQLHVSYSQTGNTLSQNGQGVISIDGGFAIIINNNPGVKLPSTGGSGTTLHYVLGSLLTLCALAVLITRRRRVE